MSGPSATGFFASTEAHRDGLVTLGSAAQDLRLVVETARDPIVMTDAGGAIVFVNPAVQRVFGYAPVELLQRPLRILLPEYDRRVRDAVGVTRDGAKLPLEISASQAMTASGTRTTLILHDGSERARATKDVVCARDE